MGTIGKKVKKAREEKGWSTTRLGIESRLGQAYISHIENGHIKSPRFDTLHKIAVALGVDVASFLPTKADYERGLSEALTEDFAKTGGKVIVEMNRVREPQAEYGKPKLKEGEVLFRLSLECTSGESGYIKKLLTILRGYDEPAKKSVIGFLDMIIGLLEKEVLRKEEGWAITPHKE